MKRKIHISLLLLFSLLFSMNGEIYANDGKPIKLVFQKEPLSEAFKKIEKTSGYKIIIVYDDVKDYTAT